MISFANRRPLVSIFILTLLLLGAFSVNFDLSRLHASGLNNYLNDQVEYVTVARRWVDEGRLENSIVYPSAVAFGEYRHLPGHSAAIALAYSVFGDHAWVYLLPSLLAALAIPVLTSSIASKLYGTRAAWLAGLFTMTFAPFLLFAFTAMPETTLIAAALAGMRLLLGLEPHRREAFVAFALLLPFVFRETGAFLIFPFLALGSLQPKRIAASFVFSILTLTGVYSLLVTPGSKALVKATLLGVSSRVKYGDTVFARSPLSTTELIDGVLRNAGEQVLVLAEGFSRFFSSPQYSTILLVFISTAVVAVLGWRRRDLFAIGVAISSLVLCSFLIAFYQVGAFVGMRMVLVLVPFLVIALSGFVMSKRAALVSLVITAAIAILEVHFALLVAPAISSSDEFDDRAISFVESLAHDSKTLLIAPLPLTQAYALRHHPTRVSMQPSNVETLALMLSKYEIGSLLYAEGQLTEGLSADEFAKLGFIQRDVREFDGVRYLLFKK